MDSGSGIATCISSILPIDAIIVLVMGHIYQNRPIDSKLNMFKKNLKIMVGPNDIVKLLFMFLRCYNMVVSNCLDNFLNNSLKF